ncbi:MAG: hypothetical protein JNJ71_02970 [Rubrivivax sp.]|nr:hypothetical protein [Rubrivivax sp.]
MSTSAACAPIAKAAVDPLLRVKQGLFRSFCGLLDREQIPYVILAGHEGYPDHIGSDIDFMVSPQDFQRLPALLGRAGAIDGATLVQVLQHEVSACYYVLAAQVGPNLVYLHPDAASHYRIRSQVWLGPQDILSRKRRSTQGFWIPSADAEFEYYLIKRIAGKARLEAVHLDRLRRCLEEDPAGCRSVLARRLPGASGPAVQQALLRGDAAWLDAEMGRLRAEMIRLNLARAERPDEPRSVMREWRRRWHRLTRPTGLVVAVLGPDGSGKSTVLDHLERELAQGFRRVARFHLRPRFGRQDRSPVAVTDPHAQAPRGTGANLAKCLYFVADYWQGWLRAVLPTKLRSGLVLFDRYFHDMLVDHRRYRLPQAFAPARWASWLIPQPDLWLILQADAETLVARKGEITLQSARELLGRYGQLAHSLDRAVIVSSQGTVDETCARAVAAVTAHMAQRAQAQLRAHGR